MCICMCKHIKVLALTSTLKLHTGELHNINIIVTIHAYITGSTVYMHMHMMIALYTGRLKQARRVVVCFIHDKKDNGCIDMLQTN